MIGLIIFVLAASGLGAVLVSLLVERLRRHPDSPAEIKWAPHLPVRYVSVNGHAMRYVKTGNGPALVLLHTMRTQLDIYQKMIAELATRFTVYAPDLPAHGWSEIPREPITVELLTEAVAGFLQELEIEDAIVAGQSIGANIPLLLAADGHRGIRGVVAINTFDYGRRWSIRGSLLLRILFGLGPIPIVGTTFLRLRNRFIEAALFKGGVADPKSIPAALLDEMMVAGQQRSHYRQFHYLLRLIEHWPAIHARYADIAVPVLIVYGDEDWSRDVDRRRTVSEIPGARSVTIAHAGHFLSLDQPEALAALIREFAATLPLLDDAEGTLKGLQVL